MISCLKKIVGFIVFFILFGFVFLSALPKPAQAAICGLGVCWCANDSDCTYSQTCGLSPTFPLGLTCIQADSCPSNGNFCIPGSVTEYQSCNDTSKHNVCLNDTTCPVVAACSKTCGAGCCSNSDCSSSQTCSNNKCVNSTPYCSSAQIKNCILYGCMPTTTGGTCKSEPYCNGGPSWSPCSRTCGGGTQSCTYTTYNGTKPCLASSCASNVSCNTQVCTTTTPKPTASHTPSPTGCNSSNCSGATTACQLNGTSCQTQGYYCSNGVCVSGWAGGSACSASSCGAVCKAGTGTTNASCGGNQTACQCNGTTCQSQGYYCSAGNCVKGWAGGSTCAQTSCNGGAGCIGTTCQQCSGSPLTCGSYLYTGGGACPTDCTACPTGTPPPSGTCTL